MKEDKQKSILINEIYFSDGISCNISEDNIN